MTTQTALSHSYTLTMTNYSHPDITTGQHTNGPPTVWLLVDDRWINTGSHSLQRVRKELDEHGTERIVAGTWLEGESDAETGNEV